jgi:hypothetical protein
MTYGTHGGAVEPGAKAQQARRHRDTTQRVAPSKRNSEGPTASEGTMTVVNGLRRIPKDYRRRLTIYWFADATE